jgi:hypothetical protein
MIGYPHLREEPPGGEVAGCEFVLDMQGFVGMGPPREHKQRHHTTGR